MSSRCQLQVKILAALAVTGIAVGAILLFTVDEAFWAADFEALKNLENNQAEVPENSKAWATEDSKSSAGIITLLGSCYLLCIASCCCCGDRAVKFLALLSPLVFSLSFVAYVVAVLLGLFTPATEILAPVLAVLIFLGLLVGSFACFVAGCCVFCGNGAGSGSIASRAPSQEKNAVLLALPWINWGVGITLALFLVVAITLACKRIFASPFFFIMGFVAVALGFCSWVFLEATYHVNDNSQKEEESSEGRHSNETPNVSV